MSNLEDHARRELVAAGYYPDSKDPLDHSIYWSTIGIVRHFGSCGHSGASAAAHLALIERLLQFKSLTPITDNPAEWQEIEEGFMGRPGVFQNRRDGRLFSEDGGKTYHNVDEQRYGWRARLFGRWKAIYTSQHSGVNV